MKSSAWIVMMIAVVFALPGVVSAVTPINGGSVGGTVTPVNTFPGDQTDPHVRGDVVSYVDGSVAKRTVRYYRFSTSADTVIPSELADSDFLPDVSGERITFTRVMADRTAIFACLTLSQSRVWPPT